MSGATGTLTGWIADPRTTAASTWVRITINGVTHDVLAATPRPDVTGGGTADPLGFADTVTLAQGANEICLYEIDDAGGLSTAPITCRTEDVR
jgi:hypothetical protein